MLDARNYASDVADNHREYLQVAIQDQMAARGVDVATGGAGRWGWWAYQGVTPGDALRGAQSNKLAVPIDRS